MAKIKLNGDTSGYIEISAPAVSGNNTLELGPGTKILTNLDNTFTGVSTFTSGLHVTGGNVKIGTTTEGQSEADDLTIATSAHTGMTIRSGTTSKGAVYFSDGTSGDSEYRGVLEYNHSDDHFRIFTAAGEKLRITSDGKIGVGVASPQQKLDVVGSAHTVAVFRPDNASVSAYGDASVVNNLVNLRMPYGSNPGSANNNGARWGIKFEGRNDGAGYGTDTGKSASIYAISEDATAGYNRQVGLAFYTSGFDANQEERLRITSNGNIGVGYASPSQKLVVKGTTSLMATNSTNQWMAYTYTDDTFRLNYNGSGADELTITSAGHVLHGVSSDEDTSGNGGLRFINSGDIQIDGDQKALVFRSTNNTAQLQSAIEWWNENGAGVQSKIACDRTAVSQGASDLVFYTSANVDTAANSGEGDITERVRIASDGTISIGVPGRNTSGGWRVKLVVPDNSSYQSALNVTNNVNADCQLEIKTNESRFGPSTNTPLVFKTNNTERIRITNVGRMGIDSAAPISKLQVGSHTFNGGNGMHSDDRVGMSNHGQLTGLMLASTYNDGAHPEYGLVFVQGPNTSSYNVWSVSPDGPAKGNSLNFHYDDQASNIHAPGFRKFQMTGEGYFLQPHQPKFRVGRNSSYSASAGSDIIFNVDSGGGKHNVGLHYNTANGRFTAPVAGVYTFTAHVIWEGLSNGQNMADCFHPKINGVVQGYSGKRAEYIANETGNSGYYTDFMTYQFTLAAGDYVTINNQYSRTIHGNSNYTTFSGHLVG